MMLLLSSIAEVDTAPAYGSFVVFGGGYYDYVAG
jgi:hypothetical protein